MFNTGLLDCCSDSILAQLTSSYPPSLTFFYAGERNKNNSLMSQANLYTDFISMERNRGQFTSFSHYLLPSLSRKTPPLGMNTHSNRTFSSTSYRWDGLDDKTKMEKVSEKFEDQSLKNKSSDYCENNLLSAADYHASSNHSNLKEKRGRKDIENKFDEVVGNSVHNNSGAEVPHLTHTDNEGKAVMVDVGSKPPTLREARAHGSIYLGPEASRLVKENKMKKGDVLSIAQLAGIMAAKQTSNLIPLCHNINLTKVSVTCELVEHTHTVDISSLARTIGQTGVEMEALTAAAVAALTVYDMCKAVTHDMVIGDVKLMSKSGGRRDFKR